MLNLLLSGMRPIIAAAKLLLFCHLGKFFALFFHKTAEIVAFTPFGATISSPFLPIDTPSAAPVFGAEIMDGSRERTDAEREIIHAFTESADTFTKSAGASDEDAGASAEDIVRIAEGTSTLPEYTSTLPEDTSTIAEDAFTIAEDAFTIAEGTFTRPEGTFTVAEGILRIIARRDMDISWLEMIVAEPDTGIECHEITLMGCCMGM